MTITERDPFTDARAAAATEATQKLEEFAGGLPANRRAEHQAIAAALTKAQVAATTARNAHDQALENLDLHPDGRRARAAQARQDGTAKVAEHYQDARARAHVLHAALIDDALRQPPGAAEAALARQDAALILSLATDKAKALHDLATDPDVAVATLATGPWGRRYLTAAGHPAEDIDNTMEVARDSALTAIADRGDDARARAARSALGINALQVAITSHEALARMDLPQVR